MSVDTMYMAPIAGLASIRHDSIFLKNGTRNFMLVNELVVMTRDT